MHDTAVSLNRIVLPALWGAVISLVAASWVTMLTGHHGLTHVLGYTACTLSAVAAVAHIRCYAVRAVNVIRILVGVETRSECEVHPFG